MGTKSRNNDKKEDKGESNDSDSTKGYDDLFAMIQGLTANALALTLSITNMDKKLTSLSNDKIDSEELNCTKTKIEADVKVVLNLAKEAEQKAIDAK